MCFNVNKSCLLRCGPSTSGTYVSQILGCYFWQWLKAQSHLQPRKWSFLEPSITYMPVLGLLPLQCYCVIYCTHSVCRSYFMIVLKQSLCLMLIFELCMLLGKLLCIKFLNWIMMLICSILNIVLVFAYKFCLRFTKIMFSVQATLSHYICS